MFVSGYGALSRHLVPRSTVAGGHDPVSCAGVLPPRCEALLTVGIAAAANLRFLPSSRTPPACGLALTVCPANVLITARRAASARPVVEKTSAISEMTSAGEGSLRAPRRARKLGRFPLTARPCRVR